MLKKLMEYIFGPPQTKKEEPSVVIDQKPEVTYVPIVEPIKITPVPPVIKAEKPAVKRGRKPKAETATKGATPKAVKKPSSKKK